jgi:hypothetical protein
MPASGPVTRRSHPIPKEDLQDSTIDAPDGENLMPVIVAASTLHALAPR